MATPDLFFFHLGRRMFSEPLLLVRTSNRGSENIFRNPFLASSGTAVPGDLITYPYMLHCTRGGGCRTPTPSRPRCLAACEAGRGSRDAQARPRVSFARVLPGRQGVTRRPGPPPREFCAGIVSELLNEEREGGRFQNPCCLCARKGRMYVFLCS